MKLCFNCCKFVRGRLVTISFNFKRWTNEIDQSDNYIIYREDMVLSEITVDIEKQ